MVFSSLGLCCRYLGIKVMKCLFHSRVNASCQFQQHNKSIIEAFVLYKLDNVNVKVSESVQQLCVSKAGFPFNKVFVLIIKTAVKTCQCIHQKIMYAYFSSE